MEALDHAAARVDRGRQPLALAGGRVQFDETEAERELRMVGQIALDARRAIAPGAVDMPVSHQCRQQEARELPRGLYEVVAP